MRREDVDACLDDWGAARDDILDRLGWPSEGSIARMMETGTSGSGGRFGDPTAASLGDMHTRDLLYTETAFNQLSGSDRYWIWVTYGVRPRRTQPKIAEDAGVSLRSYQRRIAGARESLMRARNSITPIWWDDRMARIRRP